MLFVSSHIDAAICDRHNIVIIIISLFIVLMLEFLRHAFINFFPHSDSRFIPIKIKNMRLFVYISIMQT